MQCLVKVDGKVCIDMIYFVGFMDVISIEKIGENFCFVYDIKGCFIVYCIGDEEFKYKFGKVKCVQFGCGGVLFLVMYDVRM